MTLISKEIETMTNTSIVENTTKIPEVSKENFVCDDKV